MQTGGKGCYLGGSVGLSILPAQRGGTMKKWQKLLLSASVVIAISASFMIVLLPIITMDQKWG